MEFTKENVEQMWTLFNTSRSPEEKKMADNYLMQFKKSPSVLEISQQLFDSKDENSHVLAAFVIYQNIKERINEIMDTKEEFFKFRNLIFNDILVKMKNSSSLIVERVCYSISILMLIGVITYWPESVEDILQFGKLSVENCFLSTIILGNIYKELCELNVSQKTYYRIKDIMIDKKELIKEFIFLVLTNVSPSQHDKRNDKMFNKTIELTQAWIKLELNVLKIPFLAQTLINFITAENIEKISDVFSESLSCAKSMKIYTTVENCDLSEYLEKADKEELQSVYYLIDVIKALLMNLSNKTLTQEDAEILNGIANLFSSICENYIFLFFTKDTVSSVLLELFYYFISHKRKKISYKMFECVNELREFINREYKFYNYTNDEKLQFCQLLIKISEEVMLNCKLRALSVNFDLLTRKPNSAIDEVQLLELTTQDDNYIELDPSEVSVSDYRKGAEDIFYNIFLIFIQNFGEEGSSFFINNFNKILISANITDDSIVNDNERLVVIETVLLVIKSIVDTIEVSNISSRPIIDFIGCILNSKLLLNDQMIVIFLLFLDQASPYIAKCDEMYLAASQFLLSVSKSKYLEKISTRIILDISLFSKQVNLSVFKILYDFYIENYSNLQALAISNISNALCHVVGIKDIQSQTLIGLPSEELIPYYTAIMKPATESIQNTYQYLIGSSFQENEFTQIKLALLKDYQVHFNILSKSIVLDKSLLAAMFSLHMKDAFQITENIFKFWVNDHIIIKELTKMYIEPIHALGENCLEFFDLFNNMLLDAYLKNFENYSTLFAIKNLYCDTAKGSPEKLDYVARNFLSLFNEINHNVLKMTKNQIEVLDVYAQFFAKVLDTLPYVPTDHDHLKILDESIKLFIDVLNTIVEISLNKNTLRLLSKFITCSNLIPNEALYEKFPHIVRGVFLSSDHIDSGTITDFVNFTINGLSFDENLFLATLRNTFTHKKFECFKPQHIEIIIEYIKSFWKNEKNLKRMLVDVVNITKGMGQLEALNNYGIEIARLKIEKK